MMRHATTLAKRMMQFGVALVLVLSLAIFAQAEPGTLVVKVDQPGVKISPAFYGLMTEEINHSYDGGLYAELIQNRSFKDNAQQPVHWSLVESGDAKGSIALDRSDPVNTTALTTSLRLEITKVGADQRVGVANEGFWGIPVKPDTTYRASFYARASAGFSGPLNVAIESNKGGKTLAAGSIPKLTTKWQKYELVLKTGNVEASTDNQFVISASKQGTVWLSLVSLFPPTYNNRPNGNRIDIMQKLAEMHPAFLRFPGGNYLEGDTFAERFNWKETIGPLEQRPGHRCPWGYRSSDGLGLLEFCEWCEDLKMEPVLALFAGYSLRGEHVQAGPKLEPFVNEALEEIEYVTGDAKTTKWGKQRAQDGHPEPFKLRFVEIGNEDFFDRSRSYDGRFTQFYDAIKAKYPDLQVIATTPVRTRKPDLVDDHYYRPAAVMARDSGHYDNTDRNGPKIFVGEWASQEGSPTPTMNAAVGDAAWLTGLERDSDLVILQCYAPLFVNVNRGARQWGTNLIGYDALTSFGSPSYYAQAMFAQNRGDTVLPVEVTAQELEKTATISPHGAVGVGSWATKVEYKDMKVTRGDTALLQSDLSRGKDGWDFGRGQWSVDDGMLRQSGDAQDCRATNGDTSWTDYTYSLKARKLSGAEGFLIMFHVIDRDNFIWWNIGGWGNSRTVMERCDHGAKSQFGTESSVSVEENRWYDIKIEVKGQEIRCYLDGKLICQGRDEGPGGGGLYATASRDDSSGDVILKVVNAYSQPQQIRISLQGAGNLAKQATLEVLTGEPGDVNSVEQPEKIVPKRSTIAVEAPTFVHDFPACSVSVLRLKKSN